MSKTASKADSQQSGKDDRSPAKKVVKKVTMMLHPDVIIPSSGSTRRKQREEQFSKPIVGLKADRTKVDTRNAKSIKELLNIKIEKMIEEADPSDSESLGELSSID